MTSKEEVELAYYDYQYHKGKFDRILHNYYMERPSLFLGATSEINLYNNNGYGEGYSGDIE